MLKKHDFFDRDYHKEGKGVKYLHFPQEIKGAKVVIDYAIGLTWQRSGSQTTVILKEAETYIQKLNTDKYGGYTDWRLPTLEEAMSLMEPKKHGALYIDPVFDETQRWIWTADKESASRAWYVVFNDRYCFTIDVYDYYYVRAVR